MNISKEGDESKSVAEGQEKVPFAYIYQITNLLNGRIYVGKKQLLFRKKKKVGRKLRKLPENKGKRVLITHVDAGWEKYWGSCRELTEDITRLGVSNFRKDIIDIAYNKSQASYLELMWQVNLKVLETNSYNSWIKATVYKNKLLNK